NDGKLSIWNEPRDRQMMLDRGDQNVAIAGYDEDGCLDRFQLVLRKPIPRYHLRLGEKRGPVCWIRRHPFIVLSLKLDTTMIMCEAQKFRQGCGRDGFLDLAQNRCVNRYSTNDLGMADRHLHSHSTAKALAEEVGLSDLEVFHKSGDIVGVL